MVRDTSSRAFRVGELPMKVACPSNHLSLACLPPSPSHFCTLPFTPAPTPPPLPSLLPQPHPPIITLLHLIPPTTMCSVQPPHLAFTYPPCSVNSSLLPSTHHTQHNTSITDHLSPPSLLPPFSTLPQVLNLCLASYQQWQWRMLMDVRWNVLVDATWHAGAV